MSDTVLELQDVEVSIKDRVIVSSVSFDLYASEFVYLIGSSGAGKSSLLKMLFGLIPLSRGTAVVSGYNIGSLTPQTMHHYRRKVGMIFQDFRLFKDWTVYDNLDFVLKATDWTDASQREEKIVSSLDKIGLLDLAQESVYTMSGGEQQKLAIIRALLNEPKILLADEPTGNLDPESAEQIINLLHEVSTETETAILLTTHHHYLVDQFPGRTLECKNKTVVEVD